MMAFMNPDGVNTGDATSHAPGGATAPDAWATPRIAGNQIERFVGRRVVMVVKATGVLDDTRITVECPVSSHPFTVHLNGVAASELSMVGEVVLDIDSPERIVAVSFVPLDDVFDFTSYGKLLQVMWSHGDIQKMFAE
eukprot:PhM_4_TR950/c0_g1_i1/m.23822